ncbi:MAG: GNAT family N-acetyltransferase [Candidatus Acidiferrales bacterium]
MRFVDIGLARRLEMAEAQAARECSENVVRNHPEMGAATLEIMGGVAAFTGVDSPITQAAGVGLRGPVTDSEVDALEAFFRGRSAAVNIEVCPMADASLAECLGRRAYRAIEFSNVLFRDVPGIPQKMEAPPNVQIRPMGSSEAHLWSETVATGFAEHFAVTPELVQIMEMFALRKSARCYFASIDGDVAGGAALAIHEGVAGFFGASTLPAFRRRGVQTALLSVRMADAAAAACDVAMSIAQLNSGSHRNIERQGFRVAYTRVKFSA